MELPRKLLGVFLGAMLTLPFARPSVALTYLVRSDGSGDYPTIQEAIDVTVDGDVIELADGTFVGPGNRDLDFGGRDITVRSASGDPRLVVIDCQGAGRGFHFHSGETNSARVEKLTIMNGVADHGGGIICDNSAPTITGNVIEGNVASGDYGGGGIFCGFENGDPVISKNLIVGNSSTWGSAGIYVYDETCNPTITYNTVVYNTSTTDVGGGIYLRGDIGIRVARNIIAFNSGRGLAGGLGSGTTIECNDVYGNTISNYYGIPDQTGLTGNVSAEPLFCEPAKGDFTLHSSSPCAPLDPGGSQCGLIGALPVACGNCFDFDANAGLFSFTDPNGYEHAAIPVATHAVAEGDRLSFDMQVTDCSVPGTSGAESAIGLTTEDNGYMMGILLVYDDQVCYRVRLFDLDGPPGADATLAVGLTYHYKLVYAAGMLNLEISDDEGNVVHSDAIGHGPGVGTVFQFGVDYPGGETDYFQWTDQRVEFRVDRAADPAHISGWIDNVSTPSCGFTTATPHGSAPLGFDISAIPNPLSESTVLSLELARPERVRLAIFDASGRLVRDVIDMSLAAGAHRFAWDGRTSSGTRAAEGVYFARAWSSQESGATRLVLLR